MIALMFIWAVVQVLAAAFCLVTIVPLYVLARHVIPNVFGEFMEELKRPRKPKKKKDVNGFWRWLRAEWTFFNCYGVRDRDKECDEDNIPDSTNNIAVNPQEGTR